MGWRHCLFAPGHLRSRFVTAPRACAPLCQRMPGGGTVGDARGPAHLGSYLAVDCMAQAHTQSAPTASGALGRLAWVPHVSHGTGVQCGSAAAVFGAVSVAWLLFLLVRSVFRAR